jgi:hypothetical protein
MTNQPIDSIKGTSNLEFGGNQGSLAMDFNISSEINSLSSASDNYQKQASIILNIEKMLI